MACDANSLMAAAASNGYYGLSNLDLKRAILYMICNGLGSGISGATGVYSGTTAARNLVTPPGAAVWVLTDSVPPYQLSPWNGSAWV